MPQIRSASVRKPSTTKQSYSISDSVTLKKSPEKPRRLAKGLDNISTSIKKKKKLVLINTSPRKTRGIYKKEEDLECESCNQREPFNSLFNCPNCTCAFHLTCIGLEPQTIACFTQNLTTWRCPRCISCAKCGIYIFDPDNLQCISCGCAYHGCCRPKNTVEPVYPYTNWQCHQCMPSGVLSLQQSNSRNASSSPIKGETPRKHGCPSSASKNNNSSRVGEVTPEKRNSILALPKSDLHTLRVTRSTNTEHHRSVDELTTLPAKKLSSNDSPTKSKRCGRRLTNKSVDSKEIDLKKEVEKKKIVKKLNVQNRRKSTDQKESAKVTQSTQKQEPNEPKTSESSDFSLAGKMAQQKINVLNQWVYLGPFLRFKPIYESSYSEDISSAPNVYICGFCFRPLIDLVKFQNHVEFCPWQHPPGNEIYRKDEISVFEVEGCEQRTYCRNLCLLAKFFLSSKTLYHEVDTFTFYILTEITEYGFELAGYFSKS